MKREKNSKFRRFEAIRVNFNSKLHELLVKYRVSNKIWRPFPIFQHRNQAPYLFGDPIE